jgi:hypothetical protein
MPYIADRVQETTTTTGTGPVTLSGAAAAGMRTFAIAFGTGSTLIGYCIQGQTPGEWEVGKGTFNGTTGLTREIIRSSSNANNLVNFSAGTKDVFCTAAAELVDNANIGMQLASRMGWAMP